MCCYQAWTDHLAGYGNTSRDWAGLSLARSHLLTSSFPKITWIFTFIVCHSYHHTEHVVVYAATCQSVKQCMIIIDWILLIMELFLFFAFIKSKLKMFKHFQDLHQSKVGYLCHTYVVFISLITNEFVTECTYIEIVRHIRWVLSFLPNPKALS